MQLQALKKAAIIIRQGGIIAYPTEGVYGLGCDPFNEAAVEKLLRLKQRDVAKGLIIIAANWQQVQALTAPIPPTRLNKILASWFEPITWVFPASDTVPKWISGDFASIALRITQHSLAKQLCELIGPLVSTSANIAQRPSATTDAEVTAIFGTQIDLIIDAPIGDLKSSTPILDALDDSIFRN